MGQKICVCIQKGNNLALEPAYSIESNSEIKPHPAEFTNQLKQASQLTGIPSSSMSNVLETNLLLSTSKIFPEQGLASSQRKTKEGTVKSASIGSQRKISSNTLMVNQPPPKIQKTDINKQQIENLLNIYLQHQCSAQDLNSEGSELFNVWGSSFNEPELETFSQREIYFKELITRLNKEAPKSPMSTSK